MGDRLWVVLHWLDGVLYRGYDEVVAKEIYSKAKMEVEKEYSSKNYKLDGDEFLSLLVGSKDMRGVSGHNIGRFIEDEYVIK